MKGYGQFCPIAVACEVFAERWTPLILRELLAGSRRFGELRRGLPLISRTLLAQRLRELERAGVVVSRPLARGRGRSYEPTRAAEELRGVIDQLGAWGQRWAAAQFDTDNLDMMMLMWNVRRRVDLRRLPTRRVVVRFEFRALPARQKSFRGCWLVLERRGADLCLKDPGFDVDLVVRADAAVIARVWMGAVPFAEALRSGGLALDGPRDLARAFPAWLLLSHYAGVPRADAHAVAVRPAERGA